MCCRVTSVLTAGVTLGSLWTYLTGVLVFSELTIANFFFPANYLPPSFGLEVSEPSEDLLLCSSVTLSLPSSGVSRLLPPPARQTWLLW